MPLALPKVCGARPRREISWLTRRTCWRSAASSIEILSLLSMVSVYHTQCITLSRFDDKSSTAKNGGTAPPASVRLSDDPPASVSGQIQTGVVAERIRRGPRIRCNGSPEIPPFEHILTMFIPAVHPWRIENEAPG